MVDPHDTSVPADQCAPTSRLDPPPSAKLDRSRSKKPDRATADRADRRVIKFLAVTMDADTAQVVRVEGEDATGARFELSVDAEATLATCGPRDRLESFVEEAFEAGIACVPDGRID